MGVGFIGTTSGSALNGGSPVITLPGTYKSSDCAVVTIAICSSIAPTLSVASSSGATTLYTQIVTTIRTSNLSFGVFRRIIGSTAETQITITGNAANLTSVTGVVHIFRGVNATTPEDVAATSTNGGSTTADPPSISPATAGCGIVASMGRGTSISALLTGPSEGGFLNFQSTTSADTDPATVGQAWATGGSTSPFNPGAFGSSVTGTWCSATVALRPIALTSAAGDPWREMGLTSAEEVATNLKTVVVKSY